jgi:hypothetical protein
MKLQVPGGTSFIDADGQTDREFGFGFVGSFWSFWSFLFKKRSSNTLLSSSYIFLAIAPLNTPLVLYAAQAQ